MYFLQCNGAKHGYTRVHDNRRNKKSKGYDEHIDILLKLRLFGWLSTKAGVQKGLQSYWPFRGEIAIIDSIATKDRVIIIPVALQDKKLNPLHMSHMGIQKTRLLAWINFQADVEEMG